MAFACTSATSWAPTPDPILTLSPRRGTSSRRMRRQHVITTRNSTSCDMRRWDGAIILAIAVLVAPLPSVLIGIGLWKMTTEMLFMTSGSLPFEWIERAGSDMAPWRVRSRHHSTMQTGNMALSSAALTSSPRLLGARSEVLSMGAPPTRSPPPAPWLEMKMQDAVKRGGRSCSG